MNPYPWHILPMLHWHWPKALDGWFLKKIEKLVILSLLDNAPNYLVGCVIQKRYNCLPINLINGANPSSFLIKSLLSCCLAHSAKAPTTLVKTEIFSGLNCKSSSASEFSKSNLIKVGTMPRSISRSTLSESDETFQRAPVTAASNFLLEEFSESLMRSTKGSSPPWSLWKIEKNTQNLVKE